MSCLCRAGSLLTFRPFYATLAKTIIRIFHRKGRNVFKIQQRGDETMKRIQTLETRSLCESAKKGGCGECQTSCQSACKTSCGVANQKCENTTK